MRLITLTTDFGKKDGFVGIMKGVILTINKNAKIVDISHEVKPQNIEEAAYILKSSFNYFPKDTIHAAVIDPGVGSNRNILIVRTAKYYFIVPDNGLISMCLEDKEIKEIYRIENKKYMLSHISNTFHGRDIFAPVSAYLSKGIRLGLFGRKIKFFKKIDKKEIKIRKDACKTIIPLKIIYNDIFGNAVLDIKKEEFEKYINNYKYIIYIGKEKINNISVSYAEGRRNKLIALWGSSGHLELSIKNGSAYSKINRKKIKIVAAKFR